MSDLNFNIPFAPFNPHKNCKSLVNQQFERLQVVSIYSKTKTSQVIWLCWCQCGKWITVPTNHLRNGHTRSCGCWHHDRMQTAFVTHGHTVAGNCSPEYGVYTAAKARCTNPNTISYPNYGGRGIEFRFPCFQDFLAEIGLRPTASHSINRIDNNGHYEVGNIEWELLEKQNRNKRTTHFITISGETRCFTEWLKIYGISKQTVRERIKNGDDEISAITKPRRRYQTRKL